MGIHATKTYLWEGEMRTIPEIAKRENISYKRAYHCVKRMGYNSLEQTKANRPVIIDGKLYDNLKLAALKLNKSYQQVLRLLKQKKIKYARLSKGLKPASRRNKAAKFKQAFERNGIKP